MEHFCHRRENKAIGSKTPLRQNRSKKKDFTKSMFKLTGLQSGMRRQSKEANQTRGVRQAGRQADHKQGSQTIRNRNRLARTQVHNADKRDNVWQVEMI